MKLIGERIFAKDADGNLLSRTGTMFLHTPGLVTVKTVHALQRAIWIEELSKDRVLSEEEAEAEMLESVDLIFTDSNVLIRPDPDRMDLAFRADEALQGLVSKREIRYLNTSSEKVRAALRERGENWRMSRQPISQGDMAELVEKSRVAIGQAAVYFYNRLTGTRYLSAAGYDHVLRLSAEAFRRQVVEIVTGLGKFNRLGQREIDLFPVVTPPEIKKRLRELNVDSLSDADLLEICKKIGQDWRMALPSELREESTSNFAWRNAMCEALMHGPNETNVEEQELVAGIAPEFYRQIEWLPGARIVDGEVIFDPVYDEAARTQDPELLTLCDNRVKSFLFNTMRLFGSVDWINIGRITKSLARHPVRGSRRGNVYIMQYRESGAREPKVQMIRLQKWGVAERLDEGKTLLQAIIETDEYSDYILDRRLMCRQLGMNLPRQIGFGYFTEKYRGSNQYNGCAVRTAYFVREYVPGIASDKVPPAKLRNPLFARRFAELLGEAAAIDLVVGRRSTTTSEILFDNNYEVLKVGPDALPAEILVTDHAGSFNNYQDPLERSVAAYAQPVLRRRALVADPSVFATAYIAGFERSLTTVQQAYRARKAAFDELFSDRPYDTNGSGAYRWACALKRLQACDIATVVAALKKEIDAGLQN